MNYIVLAILYSVSGFLMKLSDDEYDEKSNKLIAVIIGIVCGITIAFLASNNIDASYIFIGILIGTALSFKIDGIHHIATLLVFLLLYLIWGIFNTNGSILADLSLITLLICIISAFIDEIGNDNKWIYSKSKFLKFFFDYRFTMKLAILFLAILGYYQTITGFSLPFIDFLSFSTFIFFILFELSYELANIVFNKYFID
ncbi:hypothetical protein MARBORIA2_05480 [Methanobrevibacter arboriphilus]|uniref:Uncharacterized protein n=2 Tax=Methanobrevibacter arboriphilus TaxID=39441 RepID=A0ACA8R160_METAZ|nr:hypothetical protein [Methanobrevibacter arboriphilus]BBL61209.1 hypothetical protein MarbSA_02490 [Methanobrevibacter arboriphilus]GLI11458.1 hypothetical protein MARBORIA2_05480 [Methanobrevibacter arboriphilus]